jgi:hypothetical protein
MGSTSSGTAALFALTLLTSSAGATEPYEGAWVTNLQDCGDDDGFTSLTVIDLKFDFDGKPVPMVDRYEYHCRIEKKASVGNDTTLSVTCFEFQDYLRQNINGEKATIKLSVASKDMLKINGKLYRRCLAKGAKKKP